MSFLGAIDALLEHGGWLARIALVTWVIGLVVSLVALVARKRRSLAVVSLATLGTAWLASVAMQVHLHAAFLSGRVVEGSHAPFWIHVPTHFATLVVGGLALLLATSLSAAVIARERRTATALVPFVPLTIAAIAMVLYPLDFVEMHGRRVFVQDFDAVFERRHVDLGWLRGGVWLTTAIGSVVLVWRRRLRSRRPSHALSALAVLLLGAMVFVGSRDHAHDAAHPLPPHDFGVFVDVDVEAAKPSIPHPADVACRGLSHDAFWRFPRARLADGVQVVSHPLTPPSDLASLRRSIDSIATLYPDDPLSTRGMLLYEHPTASDVAELARHGFDELHLLTLQTHRVVTATRGELELHRTCTVPLDVPPSVVFPAIDAAEPRVVD
jgi:hypothetical protein